MKLIVLFICINIILLLSGCPRINARNPLFEDLWESFEEAYSKIDQKYQGWQPCYSLEPGETSNFLIKKASVQVFRDHETSNYLAELDVVFDIQSEDQSEIIPSSSIYTLEFWHQQSGTKIKYLGPYSACNGWLDGHECPINETIDNIHVKASRTLHKDTGIYEATLQLWGDEARTNELMCLIVPFHVVAEDALPASQIESIQVGHSSHDSSLESSEDDSQHQTLMLN